MTLAALFDTACVIYRMREGEPDEYGDAVLEPDAGTPTVCAIQRASTVLRGGSEGENLALETSRWQVFLPVDVDFGGGDYMMIGDIRYDFEGDPWRAEHPRVGHTEALARRTS